jgi:hypothetical protein
MGGKARGALNADRASPAQAVGASGRRLSNNENIHHNANTLRMIHPGLIRIAPILTAPFCPAWVSRASSRAPESPALNKPDV